jgi:hypothetical protein
MSIAIEIGLELAKKANKWKGEKLY